MLRRRRCASSRARPRHGRAGSAWEPAGPGCGGATPRVARAATRRRYAALVLARSTGRPDALVRGSGIRRAAASLAGDPVARAVLVCFRRRLLSGAHTPLVRCRRESPHGDDALCPLSSAGLSSQLTTPCAVSRCKRITHGGCLCRFTRLPVRASGARRSFHKFFFPAKVDP